LLPLLGLCLGAVLGTIFYLPIYFSGGPALGPLVSDWPLAATYLILVGAACGATLGSMLAFHRPRRV